MTMDNRTAMRLMQEASDEITRLRRQVEMLEPKAHAYDTIAQIAQLSRKDRGGYASVDINYELKTFINELQKEEQING
jgi:hypothetical protein